MKTTKEQIKKQSLKRLHQVEKANFQKMRMELSKTKLVAMRIFLNLPDHLDDTLLHMATQLKEGAGVLMVGDQTAKDLQTLADLNDETITELVK
jgi:hypothetical protein